MPGTCADSVQEGWRLWSSLLGPQSWLCLVWMVELETSWEQDHSNLNVPMTLDGTDLHLQLNALSGGILQDTGLWKGSWERECWDLWPSLPAKSGLSPIPGFSWLKPENLHEGDHRGCLAVLLQCTTTLCSVFPEPHCEGSSRKLAAVASSRIPLLFDCPVPLLQQTKETPFLLPLHTAHVLWAPNPSMTDLLWTFSSFSIPPFKMGHSLAHVASITSPTPYSSGHSSASHVTAGPCVWGLFCSQLRPCPLRLEKLQEVSAGQSHKGVEVPLDWNSYMSALKICGTLPPAR